MAINYGLIGGQQPQTGGVVATLPMVQNNGLQNLASGLLEGAQVNSQLQRNNLLNQATQQQMDQSAQMFPVELQDARNRAGKSAIDLRSAKRVEQDIINLRAAAKKGEEEYLKHLQSTDPVAAQTYLKTKADTQTAIADAAAHVADSKTKQLDFSTKLTSNLYITANQALKAEEVGGPEVGAKVYQAQLQMLGDSIVQTLPPEIKSWNNNTKAILHFSGMDAAASAMADQIMAHGTDDQKRILQRNQLEDKKNSGQKLSPTEEKTLQNLNSRIDKDSGKDDPAIQKTVEYIRNLKDKVDSLPEGSPERVKAEQDLEFSLTQAKQDVGLWGSITRAFGEATGSSIGSIINGAKNVVNNATKSSPTVSPDAARQELIRRGIIK